MFSLYTLPYMKELLSNLFIGLGQKLAMFVLIGTTALTTGTAVSRMVVRQTDAQNGQPQAQLTDNKPINTLGEENRTVKPFEDDSTITTPTPTIRLKVTPKLIITPTAILKAIVTPKATVTPSTNRCFVTLFGGLYDVTSLRSSHSGGDIFKCGTDMTSVYQGKHGTSLSRMAKYAYDPNNPVSNTVSPTGTKNSNSKDEDEHEEREDERNKDRYEKQEIEDNGN